MQRNFVYLSFEWSRPLSVYWGTKLRHLLHYQLMWFAFTLQTELFKSLFTSSPVVALYKEPLKETIQKPLKKT